MFFSFVSFITNRGFFLTGLENIVYDDVYDEMMTAMMTQGYFFKIFILGDEARENQDPIFLHGIVNVQISNYKKLNEAFFSLCFYVSRNC